MNTMEALERFLTAAMEGITELHEKVDTLTTRIESIERTHTHIADVVDELRPEVSDIVEGLQKNPMIRMMIGSKKPGDRDAIRSLENLS